MYVAICFGSSSPILSALKFLNDSGSKSKSFVNSLATYERPSSDQSPNQSMTHLLNRAGELAVRFENSGFDGFIVNTTCKFH